MYGVPPDLNLSFLHEAELIQVALGVNEVIFHFHPYATLTCSVDSWSLFDAQGVCIDRGILFPRPPFQLHRLLGLRVIGTTVTAPRLVEVIFEGGDRLRAEDTSEQFESFTINTESPHQLIIV